MGARHFDIQTVYFTCPAQFVDKLNIQIQRPYFRLDTDKRYVRDGAVDRESVMGAGDASGEDCKRLRQSIFNGEALCARHISNTYLMDISREGRAMRWIARSMIPDFYERTGGDEGGNGRKLALFPTSARVLNPGRSTLWKNIASPYVKMGGTYDLRHLGLKRRDINPPLPT